MRKAIKFVTVFFISLFTLFLVSSFTNKASIKETNSLLNLLRTKAPVTFFTTATSADGSTYYGTVVASGAIDASGKYVMPTEIHGMALHCLLLIEFPDGTITIRMNCNMRTGNGRWQVLEGTGVYAELRGNGSLVMPNETDEILTGTLQWK